MNRRTFAQLLSALAVPLWSMREQATDVVIVGGGVGGFAAALAALEAGRTVTLTEPTDWIGGQLTQQGVPPDEHRWVERLGTTHRYRTFRQQVRAHYHESNRLSQEARTAEYLNPGTCLVSRLCAEPNVTVQVLQNMLMPYLDRGQLTLLLNTVPVRAETSGDRVQAVHVRAPGGDHVLQAPYFVDATEDGTLLALAGVEHVTGAEPDTGELHASPNPSPTNAQAATWCFAMEYRGEEDHTIERPVDFDYWSNYVPDLAPPWTGKLLSLTYSHPITLEPREASFDPRPDAQTANFNLWTYRRLISPANFLPGTYPGGISLVNWPQNDYMEGGVSEGGVHAEGARSLSRSLLYWLQTEVPREDGGMGWPGLRPCGEVMGTADGLAKAPYLRESRRIRARFTVTEAHVGAAMRNAPTAAHFPDSIGIGYYRIDLHPSTGGDNYIDFDSLPFEIPLGACIPVRMQNLLPACKNIGTTHITNGCYRLHPVEWNIGESMGTLVAFCLQQGTTPHAVLESESILSAYQAALVRRGVELRWPADLE